MSPPLTPMASHGLWMLLGTVALVLLVLGLMRALFPDFSSNDGGNAPGSVQAERHPSSAAAKSPVGAPGVELPPGRG